MLRGIENPLYYLDKTLMLFGDAKVCRKYIETGGGHGYGWFSQDLQVRQRRAYKVSSCVSIRSIGP